MSFKDISYPELWQPLYPAERKHLCNFDTGYHEEHFYYYFFNLDQWFICRLQIFLIYSSGDPFVQPSGTVCAILVEDIIRNHSVKLFSIWISGSIGNII